LQAVRQVFLDLGADYWLTIKENSLEIKKHS
jgi:hypothetical protein